MRWLALTLALAAAAAAAAGQGRAQAPCRQALMLAIDVSASVDFQEYSLQAEGLAAALRDPEVYQAFMGRTEVPVWIAVFEWSSGSYQRVLVDWTAVSGAEILERIARAIETNPLPPEQSTTGIGAAIVFAGELFARGPSCPERTLDISGDGQNNDWPRPEVTRHDPLLSGITINGLVIGADFPIDHELNPNRMGALENYYRARVIKGAGAFVETAEDFNDFGNAMRRKLIRELNTLMVGGVMDGRRRR